MSFIKKILAFVLTNSKKFLVVDLVCFGIMITWFFTGTYIFGVVVDWSATIIGFIISVLLIASKVVKQDTTV